MRHLLAALVLLSAPATARESPVVVPAPSVVGDVKQCATITDAVREFEADLAKIGYPPARMLIDPVEHGRMVTLMVYGNPLLLHMVFEGGCLVGSFKTPAP